MRSDSAGAPPGLSIDNTTAFTLGFANAFSRMGMTCLADATLCDEISPSIRTTPTTLPNGPHWNPMAEVKKMTYAMVPSSGIPISAN